MSRRRERVLDVVHVSSVDPNPAGGMGRIAFHWKRQFEKRGHSFCHVGPNHVGRVPHYSLFAFRAARALRRLNPAVDAYLMHESAAWAFRTDQCPVVVFSHGLEARFARLQAQFPEGRKWWKRAFAWLYQGQIMRGIWRADLVLVCSREDKAYLERAGVSTELIRIFGNGASVSGLAATRRAEIAHAPTILLNASWIQRKGIDLLVQAAALLETKGIAATWLLVGTGKDAATVLADWPERLRSSVTVVPSFSAADEVSILKKADLFVLPSYFEGQPLSLLQAMESGLPCVTTDCSGQRDLVTHGENGFLIPTGDFASLARHLETLIDDPALGYQLGQAAARIVAGRSWEVVSDEVVGWVAEAVERFPK